MKRILFATILAVFFFSSSYTVLAECGNPADTSPKDFLRGCAASSTNAVTVDSELGKTGTETLVITIAERILAFGALFAIGAIVFSGIRYVTSAGEDEKLKTAKNTAVYALIGLILTLTAFPLVDIVVKFIYSLGTTS